MEENRKEIRDELIAKAKEAHRNFEEAQKEIEKWIVLDWNEKEKAFESGIIREDNTWGDCRITVNVPKKLLKNIVFRNFDEIFIDGERISDCGFENCGKLRISECKIDDCTFDKIGFITADETDFADSHFCNIYCRKDPVISIADGNFSRCSFENIELRKGAFLIEAFSDVWVDYCDFREIRTDEDDGDIFRCEETRGKIFKKTIEIQFVDEETCTGLEKVEII